jgi:CRISPR-associated protein Cmr5
MLVEKGVVKMVSLKEVDRNKAEFAFNSICDCKRKQEEKRIKNIRSNIENIPMYIYTNGLIATILFIMKKSKKNLDNENEDPEKEGYKEISNILLKYLENHTFNDYNFKGEELEDLIGYLLYCDSKKYRRITLDVLSIFEWLVRFADGMIEEEKTGDLHE